MDRPKNVKSFDFVLRIFIDIQYFDNFGIIKISDPLDPL